MDSMIVAHQFQGLSVLPGNSTSHATIALRLQAALNEKTVPALHGFCLQQVMPFCIAECGNVDCRQRVGRL